MFGMEPSAQLQEYNTEFFHTIKPQKKKKISILQWHERLAWNPQKQRNTEWSENSKQEDQHGQLRTMSDQTVSFKFGFFAFLSLIKTPNISPDDFFLCASLSLFSFLKLY